MSLESGPSADAPTERFEECEECGRRTGHDVSVDLRTENPKSSNAAFSREPYRVTKCIVCGHETAVRWQDV
jgi:ribosomal protein S14